MQRQGRIFALDSKELDEVAQLADKLGLDQIYSLVLEVRQLRAAYLEQQKRIGLLSKDRPPERRFQQDLFEITTTDGTGG